MLDAAEKVQWSLSGLILLVIAALFVIHFLGIAGLPSTTSLVALEPQKVSQPDFERSMSADIKKDYSSLKQKLQNTDRRLRGRGQQPKRAFRFVEPAIVERVSRLDEAVQLLQGAESRVVNDPQTGKQSLEVFNIDSGHLIEGLGIQNGDRLEMVNGQDLDFEDHNALLEVYDDALDRVRQGLPIIISVRRGPERVEIHFRTGATR